MPRQKNDAERDLSLFFTSEGTILIKLQLTLQRETDDD